MAETFIIFVVVSIKSPSYNQHFKGDCIADMPPPKKKVTQRSFWGMMTFLCIEQNNANFSVKYI